MDAAVRQTREAGPRPGAGGGDAAHGAGGAPPAAGEADAVVGLPPGHRPAFPSGEPRASAPRLVLFGVPDRRELARRAAAAAPDVRFATRRSWTDDPGEPRLPLLGRRDARVGLWYWSASEDELLAQVEAVLLRFIHPLVARGLPYCLGLPFGPEVFGPRPLTLSDRARLDLEDIGRLLGVSPPPVAVSAHQRVASSSAAGRGRRSPRTHGSHAGRPPGDAAGERPRPRHTPGGPPAGSPRAADVSLDDAQRAAVSHGRGPARVLAPAGSGKTKTLVSRVVELVDRGADPAGILLLAFNRKAAEQLEQRLAALGIATTRRLCCAPHPETRRRRFAEPDLFSPAADAGPAAPGAADGAHARPPGVHCATFNAFGYRYQREVLGARPLVDTDGAEIRLLMRQAMEAAGVSLAELRPARGSDPVGAFLAGLTRVRAALEHPGDMEIRIESTGPEPVIGVPFAATHARYLRAQASTGRQSFDDQIYLAVADMLADPVHREFIERRFDHVLVDEFQDLNGAQLALVDVLSRPHRELFVVGDDDQLIYGWRHADPRGILEFHRRTPPPPWSATYTLGTNYRCSQAVVEAAARLVANNTVREAKDVRPREGAPEGALSFAGAPTWPERADAVCRFLRAERARLACAWRDLAVLCRYRSQQLLAALALDAEGIPRSPALGYRLFTHPAARLARAYLDLVRGPESLPAADLAALLNRPNRYVPGATVKAVAGAAQPWACVRRAAAAEPEAGPRPLSDLTAAAGWLAAALRPAFDGAGSAARPAGRDGETTDRAEAPITSGQLVWAVVDAFGLEAYWEDGPTGGSPGDERDGAGPLQVLDALLLLAETYPEPRAYLAAWDRLLADEEAHVGMDEDTLAREEAEEDRVVLGTIHAAKGREYDSVVIPDYDCDVTRWGAREIEEERRVVYVGVTRARAAVLFTVDTSRPYVHPFLRELVERPEPGEHATLAAWLADEDDADLRRRVRGRLEEIEVLFPELVPVQLAGVDEG